jgi:gas vesicle protein
VFRFLFFILGIVGGFAAALLVLPLPGRTFFNKMSRLPNSIKNLIDDSFSLGISLIKIGFGLYEDFQSKFEEALSAAKDTMKETQEKTDEISKMEVKI